MDNNLTKARAYFYEFLAYPLFFHEHGGKFDRWREQLAYLATNPVTPQSEAAFANLAKFDFEKFAREQNDVLFDFSYSNIPLNASFYEDGRDDGAARLRVIECLKLSPYRRDKDACKDSEDYVGFIFLATATFLRDEVAGAANISSKLFTDVTNKFIDEFIKFLSAHKNADFFASYAVILRDFIDLERAVLGVEAPAAPIGESAAVASMKKEPFQSKMPTAKTKLRWEEFSPVISQEFDD